MQIIRAELYRVHRERSYYIFAEAFLASCLFEYAALFVLTDFVNRTSEEMLRTLYMDEYFNFGVLRVQTLEQLHELTLTNIFSSITSTGGILLFVGLLVSFHVSLFKRKVMKYLIVNEMNTKKILAACLAGILYLSSVVTVFFLVLTLLFGVITGLVQKGGFSIPQHMWGWMFYLLINTVCMSFFQTFIAFISRNYAVAVIANTGVVMSGGIVMRILGIFLGDSHKFDGVWIVSNVQSQTLWNFNISQISTEILAAVLTAVFSIGLLVGIITVQKKERYL